MQVHGTNRPTARPLTPLLDLFFDLDRQLTHFFLCRLINNYPKDTLEKIGYCAY